MNKKRGRPFQKGNTHRQGRPRGSPNKKSFLLQQILLNEGDAIIDTLIDRAVKGDRVASALCIERLISRLKDARGSTIAFGFWRNLAPFPGFRPR